jgi:FkbM family methyltransferase
MINLISNIRDKIEKVCGLNIDRAGARGSIVITGKKSRKHAWFSYRCQCKSIISDFDIDCVIDAGANEGQFAKSLRKYYSGEIHSFEPVSSAYALLSKSAESDPKWFTYNFGLGREAAEHEIHVTNNTVFSSLYNSNQSCVEKFGKQTDHLRKEKIMVRRLDACLSEIKNVSKKSKIFLKMDTQGSDLNIFKGLGSWINSIYVIQSELSVIPIYKEIPHWTDTITEFENADFAVIGMFPVNRDQYKVIEYDCLFVKSVK